MSEHQPTKPWAGEPRLDHDRAEQIRALIMREANTVADGSGGPARRRPVLVGVGAAAALVIAAGGAAAWVAATRPDDDRNGYCSVSATTDRDVWGQYGFGSAGTPDGGTPPVQAIEVCGAMWRAGVVSAPGVPAGTIPTLTACVVDGTLVVYPEPAEVCGQLGVPAAITG